MFTIPLAGSLAPCQVQFRRIRTLSILSYPQKPKRYVPLKSERNIRLILGGNFCIYRSRHYHKEHIGDLECVAIIPTNDSLLMLAHDSPNKRVASFGSVSVRDCPGLRMYTVLALSKGAKAKRLGIHIGILVSFIMPLSPYFDAEGRGVPLIPFIPSLVWS